MAENDLSGEDNRREYVHVQDGIEHTVLATPEDAEARGYTEKGAHKAGSPTTTKKVTPENKSGE